VIRPAAADEAPAIAALVEAAYTPWVPIVGRRPAPMDDDFAARIASQQAWVLAENGRLLGVLILEGHQGHRLLVNIAIAPASARGGLGRMLLAFTEAEARR
jgi:N-acetylglutamate synthase-like GNAT family acetyltransferase